VQIGKSFGADVTGICSTRNVDFVRSLGADQVIDYTKEDLTNSRQCFDVILDNVGNHSLSACRRVLNPRGKKVSDSARGMSRSMLKFAGGSGDITTPTLSCFDL
jgi:NADPH:quinone reductase-like Zn-dependent oxidoreductase